MDFFLLPYISNLVIFLVAALLTLPFSNFQNKPALVKFVCYVSLIAPAVLAFFNIIFPLAPNQETLNFLVVLIFIYFALFEEFGKLIAWLLSFVLLYFFTSVVFFQETITGRIPVNNVNESFLIDNNDKRFVVKSNAIELGKKVVGSSIDRYPDISLGSVLKIETDSVNIDIVQGKRVWVLPLDFHKIFNQSRLDHSIPAFIMVDATSIDSEAQLISKNANGEDINIKYSNGMFFGQNLKRYVTTQYPNKYVYDYKIRLDDDLNPHYIGYVVKPSVIFRHYENNGVIHINLQTGEHAYYDKKEASEALPWLEITSSPDLTLEILEDWGKFRESAFAIFTNPSSILKPTTSPVSEDISFIESSIGNIWYTGITSNSTDDDSLVGLMGVNTLTGEAAFYRYQGKTGGDEDAAISAVSNVLGNEADKWSPVQPIPYNLLGKYPTYIVPVVSKANSMFMGIGLINMEHTTKVVFIKGNNIKKAINAYLGSINSSDKVNVNSSDIIKIEGIVQSFKTFSLNDSPYIYINLYNDDRVYSCNANDVIRCFKVVENQNITLKTLSNYDGINKIIDLE